MYDCLIKNYLHISRDMNNLLTFFMSVNCKHFETCFI